MKNSDKLNNLPLFASAPYYSKKKFQFPTSAVTATVKHTTVLKNNSGITILYFHHGSGRIIVNSREYLIHKGLLMVMGAYHYYQFKPDPGYDLELTMCRLSYDTFLYMAANPYYKLTELTLNIDPLAYLLEGNMLERTEAIVRKLSLASAKHKQKGGETEFLLSMKLMGIIQKTHSLANRKISN